MKKCDVLRERHVPGKVARVYGTDKNGTIVYEFNSKGYRSDEYDPSSKFRICIIGDSHAFGTGLRVEDTYGYKLKQHVAASLSLDLAEINLINLSAGGVSADYCVRTLHRQVSDCNVDLLVCQFPNLTRTEYIDDEGYHFYNLKGGSPKDLERAPESFLEYGDYFNSYIGELNQNALLAQAFLKERNIDYVLAIQHLPRPRREYVFLGSYFDQLDTSAVLWHEYFISKADLAADRRHAGRRCHAAFAVEVMDLFGRLQLKRGYKHQGRRIRKYAAHLKAADEDWAYCKAFAARQPQL